MRKAKISFVCTLVLSLVIMLAPAAGAAGDVPVTEGSSAGNESTTIQLIHVNDVHSRVFEDPNAGMGYAKMATLVKQYREKNPNTLLFDAGDTFHGQTFSTLVRGESIVKIMNAMGFDVQAAGNHDFNYGTDRLLELAEMADFAILGGNVDRDGQDVLPANTIIEMDGVRIGIFGLATPETAYKTHPNNVKGITFVDPVVEAQKQVDYLKDKADVIIALGHIGMDKSSTHTSDKIAAQVDGIDIIIDGHSHQVISQIINDTLVVQTGEYLKNVGVVTLTIENGEVTNKASEMISKEQMAEAVPDQEIAELIESIKASQDTILNDVVGKTAVVLDGERATVRAKESNLGNLITDAMLATTGADIAITNGGGIRASIDKGDITTGEVITVLPFGNYIATINATGAEIVAALQHGAGDYPELKGAFPQVAGISYAIDPSKPKGEKVHSVMVKGKPIDLNKTYVLATNDFMAAGGDEYTMFGDNPITGNFSALDEAVINYIQSKGTIAPKVEGRIVEKAADAKGSSGGKSNGNANGGSKAGSSNVYVVKPGDTLYRIGLKYGVSWQSIAKLNKLKNPNLIYPNQKLIIPAK
ncbi:5'-nucleotidase C-terminal domain-containing protein [Paenibacillus thermotolerans]|uniref:5'-nucleotidase C-terminal domain-containing protein n=1 Tax=Paenibacillus thermotolerans TaxID=3027807 RepID=UPI00308230BE